MVSKIYFIRHGITEGNLHKWFYGKTEVHLTEQGKETLREYKAENVYPDFPEDADYYTTGMIRTEETFKILFGDKEHRVIKDLQEMNFGKCECKNYDDMKDDPVFDKWAWDTTGDVRLPEAETKNEFTARIAGGLKELTGYHRLKELSHRHSGKDAVSVIVCHGGSIGSIMNTMFPGERENMWAWIPKPGRGYVVNFEKSDPVSHEDL